MWLDNESNAIVVRALGLYQPQSYSEAIAIDLMKVIWSCLVLYIN